MSAPVSPAPARPLAIAVAVLVAAGGAALAVSALLQSGRVRAPDAGGPGEQVAAAASRPATAADAVGEPVAGVRSNAIASADVEVRVVDEADRPVANATVRLRERIVDHPIAASDPGPAAVTDSNGRAVLHSVPGGRWFATAEHPDLLWAPDLQSGGRRSLIDVPDKVTTTVHLGEPRVVGVRVRGGEVLHVQLDRVGRTFVMPWDTNHDVLLRKLQARWPGARFLLSLRAPDDRRRPDDRCAATVIVRGRTTWTSNLSPVPLREFQGPIELDAAQLTRSADFGGIALRALDVCGNVTGGLGVTVTTGFGGALHVEREIQNGSEATLPGGDYAVRCGEPFLQQLLPPGITLGGGRRLSIDCGGLLLTRCEIALDGPPATRTVRLQHSALQKPVDRTVRGRSTLSCWLPEGTITATFLGDAADLGVGAASGTPRFRTVELGRSAMVVVGCGTLASPQHVTLRPIAPR